jgi:hypothetical protein
VVAGVAILLGRESGALLMGESANPALDNVFAQYTPTPEQKRAARIRCATLHGCLLAKSEAQLVVRQN